MLAERGFHSLSHDEPAQLDFYGACAVDGLGQVIHERLLAIELRVGSTPRPRDPSVLADMIPALATNGSTVTQLAEESASLNEKALFPSRRKSAPRARPRWPGLRTRRAFADRDLTACSPGLLGPERVAHARVLPHVANNVDAVYEIGRRADSADTVCRIPAGHHPVVVSASEVHESELYRVGLAGSTATPSTTLTH